MSFPDQLTAWQQIREQVPWRTVVPHLTSPIHAVRDGFATHPRLGSLPTEVRRTATTGAALTPAVTARWNALLRGLPEVTFRRGPAFAKNGRDRYGLHADTEQRYASCLHDAADPTLPAASRAARAYLDVAFFHPYDDGNARLAALVLHYVLLQAAIELDEVRPILTVVRRADDPDGAAGLARLVHGIAQATHRRWARSSRPRRLFIGL
ncbi:Fic family protein [Paractinoplanes lichenicola]|uniref:Fic family protein n=1 Tax=Paractinoplanes lichenicola TaxID=2802976 RepID=A0ABS1VHW1_9ACTN|nr:Fic family protein [Actinoplanes lichenicola]MBL7254203.1 Fic family protein [Actinoplanes lichenicola]